MKRVAVLCAARNSVYHALPDVDVYDMTRDARTFDGGCPIVAHPPCRAWSAFCAHQAKPQPGERELGPLCVDWLRECGGVLEHPAHSRLFYELDLPLPGIDRQRHDRLWSIAVQQAWFGDSRTKSTWLLFSGIHADEVQLPYRLHDPSGDRRRWQVMSKHQRSATPPALAEWLVSLAREARI